LTAIKQYLNGKACLTDYFSQFQNYNGNCLYAGDGNHSPYNPPQICGNDIGLKWFLFNYGPLGNQCEGWQIYHGSNDFGFGQPLCALFAGSGSGRTSGVIHIDAGSSSAAGNLNAIAGLCGLIATTTLPFWDAANAHFTVTVNKFFSVADGGGIDNSKTTVLEFGDATFTVAPGCPICACNAPCSRSATLNGVTYDCLPPEITAQISLTTREGVFPTESSTKPGEVLADAAMSAVNSLPLVYLPLVSWNGNAATYRYDYPIYNTTFLRYEVTLFCSAACQPSDALDTACVKAYLVNKSTATPTPAPQWPITAFDAIGGAFYKTLSEASFYFTGFQASGPALPTPDLTINKTCTGNSSGAAVYDASGAQDLAGGSRITAGPFTAAGYTLDSVTLYLTQANITVGVP
jgi:hypothetical protein